MSNVVGRRTQEAQKCKTSILLDEVLDEQGGVGSFSIPMDQRYMLQAQLAGARDTGYVSLPGHSVAESLAAGIHSINPGSEMLTFHPCDEVGWTSQRHLGEGSA